MSKFLPDSVQKKSPRKLILCGFTKKEGNEMGSLLQKRLGFEYIDLEERMGGLDRLIKKGNADYLAEYQENLVAQFEMEKGKILGISLPRVSLLRDFENGVFALIVPKSLPLNLHPSFQLIKEAAGDFLLDMNSDFQVKVDLILDSGKSVFKQRDDILGIFQL